MAGAGEAAPWLEICRRGLWEQRLIRIRYGGRDRDFGVAPLGLVAKGSAWYLVGRRDDQQIRTYRVSRIKNATMTDQAFDRPAEFDLATHWADACRRLRTSWPKYPVVLEIRNESLRRFSWDPSIKVTEKPGGRSTVEINLENIGEATSFLLGLGGDAVVISPAELRAEIHRTAKLLARLHA